MGWIRELGSGKNLSRIPDPGVKEAKSKKQRIPDLDPQHCFYEIKTVQHIM
jgi:hypothetical protein